AGSLLVQYATISGCSGVTGGGVQVDGNTSLIHAAISGCSAYYKAPIKARGGALYASGTLLVSYSTITNNYSQNYTGGAFAKGDITMNRTLIAHNVANFSTGTKSYGSLRAYPRCTALAGNAHATVLSSTLDSNLAANVAPVAGARKAALCAYFSLDVD